MGGDRISTLVAQLKLWSMSLARVVSIFSVPLAASRRSPGFGLGLSHYPKKRISIENTVNPMAQTRPIDAATFRVHVQCHRWVESRRGIEIVVLVIESQFVAFTKSTHVINTHVEIKRVVRVKETDLDLSDPAICIKHHGGSTSHR
jgi:hypothetical protein